MAKLYEYLYKKCLTNYTWEYYYIEDNDVQNNRRRFCKSVYLFSPCRKNQQSTTYHTTTVVYSTYSHTVDRFFTYTRWTSQSLMHVRYALTLITHKILHALTHSKLGKRNATAFLLLYIKQIEKAPHRRCFCVLTVAVKDGVFHDNIINLFDSR